MSEWYYADAGNTRQGPVPAAALTRLRLAGQLSWESLVWRDGMADWQPMRDVAADLAQDEDRDTLMAPAVAAPATAAGDSGVDAGPAGADGFAGSGYPGADASDAAASPYAPPVAPVSSGPAVVHGGEVVYAGFWKRVAASIIDSFVTGAIGMVIGMVLGLPLMLMLGAAGGDSGAGVVLAQLVMNALSLAVGVAYYAWFHSSKMMATPGKLALGIKVVRGNGERISFLRGVGRYFAIIPSALILGIGFLMAGFTERKQALHDMICDTLVVDKWAYTDRPDLQRPELGVVAWIVLGLTGGLFLLFMALMVALGVSLASLGS